MPRRLVLTVWTAMHVSGRMMVHVENDIESYKSNNSSRSLFMSRKVNMLYLSEGTLGFQRAVLKYFKWLQKQVRKTRENTEHRKSYSHIFQVNREEDRNTALEYTKKGICHSTLLESFHQKIYQLVWNVSSSVQKIWSNNDQMYIYSNNNLFTNISISICMYV